MKKNLTSDLVKETETKKKRPCIIVSNDHYNQYFNYLSKRCVLTKILTNMAKVNNSVALRSVTSLNMKNKIRLTTNHKYKILIAFSIYFTLY
ncbi:type II toxin-antitoxin system PemK/MazF family toxin [Liquorilactobacillus vini]|uniref:type II toxin-antitoxin system PemK/MazF family toxin n=1 Tax=Liquorilactobacillus vini TaxID=238015 RepID=UPI0009DAEF1E|nr:type II toxin-antitoxin system PemK/MazF family toxin [Liquorilactobacillus vini]